MNPCRLLSVVLKAPMLYTSYVVGITVLAVLPLLFLIARLLAKRSQRTPWSIDDTLLVLSLVQQESQYCVPVSLTCH
jgi:hypothetical protein